MKRRSYALNLLAIVLTVSAAGPAAGEPALGEVALHQAILDLGTDLRLMCVAAHPDDEDSATLATYRKKFGYKTIALIATRGEGGQNEIGPELYEELGVIRTHEMMRASAITGAELHFLDLPEFGYSKSREETFAVWGQEEALRRMVRKIRETRPDVIITHHGPRGGHGHHQAVGKTLVDAFYASADPNMFPEQIAEGLVPWQPARLYERGDGISVNTSDLDPLRGFTYSEIAGQALREHESQGMGFWVGRFTRRRGGREYELMLEAPGGTQGGGKVSPVGGVLFEGLQDRATEKERRLSGDALNGTLDLKRDVLRHLAGIRDKNSTAWARANRLAWTALELQLNARAEDAEVVPGQTLRIETQVRDFGEADTEEATISIVPSDFVYAKATNPQTVSLDNGDAMQSFDVDIPGNLKVTLPHPAKLFEPRFLEPQYTVVASIKIDRATVELTAPILVDVAPDVSLAFVDAPYLVRRGEDSEAQFKLLVTNHSPGARAATITISASKGLRVKSRKINVDFAAEGDQKLLPLVAGVARNLKPDDYFLEAYIAETGEVARGAARLINVDLPKKIRVGVIESYDNTFMNTLDRLNVPHQALQIDDFTAERLDAYTTIIVDIRAYLVRPDLKANNQALLDYVKRGGTAIVMYQKTFDWESDYAPYPLELGRNRVTVEEAPIKILEPDHPLFNSPNKIEPADWDGWRQERGLYFPDEWDDRYTPLIDTNDPGENPPPGSCLITQHGKGTYLYTALGWYRQLRDLHPGTLRIFANMLDL